MDLVADIEYTGNRMRGILRMSPDERICVQLPEGTILPQDAIDYLKTKNIFLQVEEVEADF
jgi:hypothetical protein